MSLAVLAKKAAIGKGVTPSGPHIQSFSVYNPARCCKPIWKPVADQSQSERIHKAKVEYFGSNCFTVQKTDSKGCQCDEGKYRGTKIGSGSYTKDLRTRSGSEYITVYESSRTCYSNEAEPKHNEC